LFATGRGGKRGRGKKKERYLPVKKEEGESPGCWSISLNNHH